VPLLWLLLVPLAHGASDSSAEPQAEVVVEATREALVKLGKEVLQSEHRFYARYNELNTKREYAVHCYDDPHTSSRFKRHYCQPQYQSDAEAAEGRDYALYIGSVSGLGSPSMPLPMPRELAIAAGRPGFQKNMVDVVKKNPELQKMLQEHADLWHRYELLYLRVERRPLLGKMPEGAPKTDSK
jgi:hypothetical protein